MNRKERRAERAKERPTVVPLDRLLAVLPKLDKEIEAAAIADQIVHVSIRRDGSVDGVKLIPRRELKDGGDPRLARPPAVKPGEYAAAWVFGDIEGVAPEENPLARAGLRGKEPWPPDNLEHLLRQRTESLIPTLASAIRRASETDAVLMLIFTGSGVWGERHGLTPRAEMVARGDTFCAERPSLRAGEVWVCWAFAVDSATGRGVPMRLSAVPETKGGDA